MLLKLKDWKHEPPACAGVTKKKFLSMKTLREILAEAESRRVAVGHFNVSELAALKGIFSAARALSAIRDPQAAIPLLIGTSEGERDFIGVRQAVVLVKSLREQYDYPIFLNADHTHSLAKVREAAEAGYDEILFDGSSLAFEENIRATQEAVKIVRSVNPSIVIEGEIGYIGSNSEILGERPEHSLTLSTPEEAVRFAQETGIDVLAPAVGNMHGLLKTMVAGTEQKHLDIPLIEDIKRACGVYMTLHGGSDTVDADFAAAIRGGMNIVHVSSELRLAWRRGVEAGLAADANEIAPYKLLAGSVSGIEKIVSDRLKLFNGLSQ
jgi:fructose-bisphosphate aldolase class II